MLLNTIIKLTLTYVYKVRMLKKKKKNVKKTLVHKNVRNVMFHGN